jgi:hypothetical protein
VHPHLTHEKSYTLFYTIGQSSFGICEINFLSFIRKQSSVVVT